MPKSGQTFNDGVCVIYALQNAAPNGRTPEERLVKKRGPLRYDSRTVGVARYYTAKRDQERIDRLIRVPRQGDLSPLDICVTEDGAQYRIRQVQRPKETAPPVEDLALERLGVDYGYW